MADRIGAGTHLVDCAKAGYEGYAAFTGGKTFDGRDMPTWEELPVRIREAWDAAHIAMRRHEAEVTLAYLPPLKPR